MSSFEWLTIVLGYSTLIFSIVLGAISLCVKVGKVEQRISSFEERTNDKFQTIEYKITNLQKSIDSMNAHIEKMADRLVDLSLYELKGSRSRKKAG